MRCNLHNAHTMHPQEDKEASDGAILFSPGCSPSSAPRPHPPPRDQTPRACKWVLNPGVMQILISADSDQLWLQNNATRGVCSRSSTNTAPHLPLSQGVSTVVMKNWEPLVLGPALAMLITAATHTQGIGDLRLTTRIEACTCGEDGKGTA